MSISKRLSQVYERSPRIQLAQNSKLVLMSDCHRGAGNGADNFAKNQSLYYVALQHYHREGYTYIELGDGDDLWENKHFEDIAAQYGHVFELLSILYRQGRMHMIYGNHDMVKKKEKWTAHNLYTRLDEWLHKPVPLFPGIQVHEGLVLQQSGAEILLLHGHQADIFNYDFWRLSEFLVRHVWRPLELIGIQDPSSASKNKGRRLSVEGQLGAWAQKHQKMLIAGHTHRSVFPGPEEGLYFNDGCTVHPRYITALELKNGTIALVQWHITTKQNGVLYVSREIMRGPETMAEYFQPVK